MSNPCEATILVIDDESIIRDSYRDYLEDRNYNIMTAENGRVGLDILSESQPDLVLVDLRMPEVDGLEVLQHMKASTPEIPVIVVSGTGVISDAVEALHYGAWNYLLKPVEDMSVLLHAVENALEKARLRQENREHRKNLEELVTRRTQQISELNDRLRAIVKSTRAITTCDSIHEVGNRMLNEFAKNMASEGGSLFLLEDGKLVRKHTLDPQHTVDVIPLPVPDESVIGKALTQKQPVLIRDISMAADVLPNRSEKYTNDSLLTIPLFDNQDNVMGVVTLHNKTQPPFTEHDKEIGLILASHSCEAIKAAIAKEFLEKSEERYRELVENIDEALYIVDPDGVVVYSSPAVQTITGYSPSEIVGRNFRMLFPPEEIGHLNTAIDDIGKEPPIQNEYQIKHKSGKTVWVRSSSRPIPQPDGRFGAQGIISDITVSKAAEEQVRAKVKELAILNRLGRKMSSDLNLMSTIQVSLEHTFNAFDPDLVLLFRKAGNDLVLMGVFPEDSPYHTKETQPHRVNECLCGMAVNDKKPVFSRDIANDPRCTLDECKKAGLRSFAALPLISGEDIIGVLGIAAKHGREFETQSSFLEALSNQIVIGIKNAMLFEKATSDAAELQEKLIQIRNAEKETEVLSKQLQQTQKMEAIGTLAGGIAHDFNNILSGIIGYTELVMLSLPAGDDPVRDKLSRVLDAGMRAKDLVRQILQFSRDEKNILAPLSLKPLTKEVIKLIRSTFPSTIDIQQDITAASDQVLADATQIHQVLMNLCTNSYHAMREKPGILTIALTNVRLAHEKRNLTMQIPPGEYVKITIADTGNGIPSNVRDRIFEPYFTTKTAEDGTGLGLSVTFGIVHDHNGLIEIESTSKKGTTFAVYLPLTSSQQKITTTQTSTNLKGQGQHVLVVDDEFFSLDILCEHLKSMGYHATGFHSSTEALKALEANPHSFDLIITDLTMPGITGIQLVSKIRRHNSDTPVILCTGFSETVTEQTAEHYGISKFLMKPVNREALEEAVHELMNTTGVLQPFKEQRRGHVR